ncbi:hypothetical protein PENSPDRAFT_681820 [Peniophora sp. CONT]|nr:hypothetical protein PENSPDRAFT_681820 [Peniophora sp. CONT]
MRYTSLLGAAAFLATAVHAVDIVSPVLDKVNEMFSSEPELLAVAEFPESNPFGHVVNGEQNRMDLRIENSSGKNVTLLTIAGGFYSPQDTLIKPTQNLTYGLNLVDGIKLALPYQFHSELKPGEVKLKIEIEHLSEGVRYRVPVFDSIVTVVEPEISAFDIKMLSTYVMVLSLLGAAGYFSYLTFVPQPKVKKGRVAPVSEPVAVTATGAGGYQEEWIPEHHIKKTARGKKTGVVSSGDELSGGETSGAEGKRRKGRK